MIGMLDFNCDYGFVCFDLRVMSFVGVAISLHAIAGIKFKLVKLMLRCIILGGHYNFIHRLKYLIAET